MRPEFDSGDHLHPNDAGYKAMGESVDLASSGRARRVAFTIDFHVCAVTAVSQRGLCVEGLAIVQRGSSATPVR